MDKVRFLQQAIQDVRDVRPHVPPEVWAKTYVPRLIKLQDQVEAEMKRRGQEGKIVSLADVVPDVTPSASDWLTRYLRSKSKHEVRCGHVCPAHAEHVDVILRDAAAAGYSRRSIKQARVDAGADVKHVPNSKLWMWCFESPPNNRVVTVVFPAVGRVVQWLESYLAQGDRHALLSKEVRRFTPEQVEYAKKKLGVREYRDQEGVLTWSLN